MTASIWKLKNTAPITKMSIESTVATASLALIASPVGIAVLFIAAVYFAALAISSYQQMHKNEEIGVNGKDADFSVLLDNAIVKSGTIVEEKEGKNDVQQLFLKLPIADYKELAKDNKTVHILLANGKFVELDYKDPDANATEYKVQLTSVDGKYQPADMKAELDMAADSKLTVAVGDKDLESLKNGVSTKLGEFVVNAAISKVIISK